VVLIYSLIARFGFNMPGWVVGMLVTIYLERVITAWGAGRKGVEAGHAHRVDRPGSREPPPRQAHPRSHLCHRSPMSSPFISYLP